MSIFKELVLHPIPALAAVGNFGIHIGLPIVAELYFTNFNFLFLSVVLPALSLAIYYLFFVTIQTRIKKEKVKIYKKICISAFICVAFFSLAGICLSINNIGYLQHNENKFYIKGFEYTQDAKDMIQERGINDDSQLMKNNSYDPTECWEISSITTAKWLIIANFILLVISFDVMASAFVGFKKSLPINKQ